MSIYISVAAGVAISVLLPLIRALLPKPPSALRNGKYWEIAKPYVATGIFSLIAAVLVVALMEGQLDSWQTALLAGYMWDSTLQKATTGNVQPQAS
jgi:hypothetical protein